MWCKTAAHSAVSSGFIMAGNTHKREPLALFSLPSPNEIISTMSQCSHIHRSNTQQALPSQPSHTLRRARTFAPWFHQVQVVFHPSVISSLLLVREPTAGCATVCFLRFERLPRGRRRLRNEAVACCSLALTGGGVMKRPDLYVEINSNIRFQ